MDASNLKKLYQANYSILLAKTEDEILQAVKNSLFLVPFVSVYFHKNNDGLKCQFTYLPSSHSGLPVGMDEISISAEEARLLPRETQIKASISGNLPSKMNVIFSGLNCKEVAYIPAILDGSLLGVILLADQPEAPITLDGIEPLIGIADILPQAFKNITETKRATLRLNELETIAETGFLISTLTDLNSIFKTLHARITASMRDVDFSIALYNPKNETIELPYVYEGGEVKAIDSFPLGEGVISVLLRTQQPLMFVTDTGRHLAALGAKIVGRPAKSWLGCPMVVANSAIGSLVVQDLVNENRFNDDDLRFLLSLSSQAAGAINNIRLLEDARRNSLELQTVALISHEVSNSINLDDYLRQVVSLLHDQFHFYNAAIFLVERNSETLLLRASSWIDSTQNSHSNLKHEIGSKSMIGFVSSQKETMVVNNISKDADLQTLSLLPNTKAEVCIPLLAGDRLLGVMDILDEHPYSFTNENVRILQILADQLSVAIINSELFSEAQERISQHRLLHHITTAAASSSTIQDVLNSAVQGLLVAMGGDQISIMMADRESKNLEVRAAAGYPSEESARLKIPFGVGVTGNSALQRKSILVQDTTKDSRYIAVNPKVRSELAIPLLYRNEVLGILNVESTRLNAFNNNDEEMLGTLAGSLAAIIAHSRLLDEYRHEVEREHLLANITNKIRRTTNPDLILSIAANEISKVLNTRRTQIEVNLQNVKQDRNNPPDSLLNNGN